MEGESVPVAVLEGETCPQPAGAGAGAAGESLPVEDKTEDKNVGNDCDNASVDKKSDSFSVDKRGDCDSVNKKDESGGVSGVSEPDCQVVVALKEPGVFVEGESGEANEETRSLGDVDSVGAGDSGVEGCGRALSSGGGSRSCASSVVSCGSGCGSESSSLAGAPPRARRRATVTLADQKRSSPASVSTPRPVTAPRGPNLATRERARSREKPTPPEKPRPLTPKPRIRPDLPNLVRESPALRAKPTKTSAARCRTPSSPCEDKKWQAGAARLSALDPLAARGAADKYGTLPRRRRDAGPDASPPPRRPAVARSVSTRSAIKTRIRIFAEKTCQTVILGTDVEAALGGIVPDIERRAEVGRCHRGVQT